MPEVNGIDCRNSAEAQDAGVVDQRVDRPELIFDLADNPFGERRVAVADVSIPTLRGAAEGGGDLPGGLFERLGGAANQRKRGTGLGRSNADVTARHG